MLISLYIYDNMNGCSKGLIIIFLSKCLQNRHKRYTYEGVENTSISLYIFFWQLFFFPVYSTHHSAKKAGAFEVINIF